MKFAINLHTLALIIATSQRHLQFGAQTFDLDGDLDGRFI
jgi:hypothetical protein